MTRPAILERLRGVQKAGEGWLAFCPAHDDHKKQSLSVGRGQDGRTLLNCHAAQCPVERIASAVHMSLSELGPTDGHAPRPSRRREVCAYDYHDETGTTLLYQVVRYAPKDFRMRRPDGAGGWVPNAEGVRRVLYRLPELTEQRRVFLCEGEKDTDRLVALGLAATTIPGGATAWRDAYAEQLHRAGAALIIALPHNDDAGRALIGDAAPALLRRGIEVRVLTLPGLLPKGDVSDWFDAGHDVDALVALAADAPPFVVADAGAPVASGAPAPGAVLRQGLDLVLPWSPATRFTLTAIRDGREGVRGELTVEHDGRRLSWGALALSSTQAREALRKKLADAVSAVPWGDVLEEATWRLTQAAREGEPLAPLTGRMVTPPPALMPGMLYYGEPTLLYADGDVGKSLTAQALAVVTQAGAALPHGLRPAQVVQVAYLDWETSRNTVDSRVALLAAGLGIDPPAILYKRMVRPLVDEASALAADFARRDVGLVIIDSKMFAVAGGDGAAFHEPITQFYGALRLFAPAASLVLNHVTGADARSGAPARPFGGAFAFNGPRLIWEAKRDAEVTDATAIVFACRKANNLPRRPAPFGLRFQPGAGTITVFPFDLAAAAPQAVASVPLAARLTRVLASGPQTVEALVATTGAPEDSIRHTLRRDKGVTFVSVPNAKPQQWALRSARE